MRPTSAPIIIPPKSGCQEKAAMKAVDGGSKRRRGGSVAAV
jgi:hypothetical protein